MSVVELGRARASAEAVGITDKEWTVLRQARWAHALVFYVELRRTFAAEHDTRRCFHLPAHELATMPFLPGHRDRKLYLRLTQELVRLGLLERVTKAGFCADGNRTAAAYTFIKPDRRSSTVVFFSDFQDRRRR